MVADCTLFHEPNVCLCLGIISIYDIQAIVQNLYDWYSHHISNQYIEGCLPPHFILKKMMIDLRNKMLLHGCNLFADLDIQICTRSADLRLMSTYFVRFSHLIYKNFSEILQYIINYLNPTINNILRALSVYRYVFQPQQRYNYLFKLYYSFLPNPNA